MPDPDPVQLQKQDMKLVHKERDLQSWLSEELIGGDICSRNCVGEHLEALLREESPAFTVP